MRPRLLITVAIGVLLLSGVFLPHVAVVEDASFGRSLLRTGTYFLNVQATAFNASVDMPILAFAFNITYLGIALQQLGLVAGAVSFWVVAAEDFNRWVYRIAVVAAWMLALSQPLVITGWFLMNRAGAPADIGLAWLPTLVGGVAVLVATKMSAERVDEDWYLTRPELQ